MSGEWKAAGAHGLAEPPPEDQGKGGQRSFKSPWGTGSPMPPRTADALRLLAWVVWLRSSDLQLALRLSGRSIHDYLRKLHLRGLIRRADLPGPIPGGALKLNYLSPKGARAASELLGYPIYAPRRSDWMTPLLYHKLETSEALCRFAGALGESLVSVRTGKALAARLGSSRQKRPYMPDASFSFYSPQRRVPLLRHAFLEIDRGTEDAAVLTTKLQALHRYVASGNYRTDFRAERLVVLFITPSSARRAQIERAILDVRPCVRVFVGRRHEGQGDADILAGWSDPLRSAEFHLTDSIDEKVEDQS